MNVASLNINGVGSASKRKWVRKICKDNNINFIGIQESKSKRDGCLFIHSMWGAQNMDYAIKKADGLSGGIIAIWDDSMFKKHRIVDDVEGFIAIFGEWINFGLSCLMIVVYAPQNINKKRIIWSKLADTILNFNGITIVLGDFNEARIETERLGSTFCKRGAKLFNDFIYNSQLVDLPMGGRKFWRMNKFGTKLSKIDRILHRKDVRDDGSPKVSNSSPLVSLTATINMPRGLCNVDVAATFGVPLTTVGDLHLLIKSIEAGKHDELLSGMTNDERMAIMDALDTICNSIQADNTNADVIPCKVSHVDDLTNLNIDESTMPNDPIVQSVDINTKSTSYAGAAGASAKDQPKVNSNFRHLVADPVFYGVNISISRKVVEKVSTRFEHTLYGYFIGKRMAFPVVEYYARNNWAKHGLKRIMMNNKGFFFFKFDSRVRLEAILEGGPWLIHNSPIILKKWSMDTRLLIPIWVKLHDVPIQVFEEDGISLIATFIGKHIMLDSYTSSMCNDSWGRSSFARCLIEVNSEVDLVDVVTIGIPSLSKDDFTKETICVDPPIVATSNVVTPNPEKTNDGFQTVGKKKKRKGKSKSTNRGQFTGPLVKHNVIYEPKATTSAPKKGTTYVGYTSQSTSMLKTTGISSKKDNLSMSNSFSVLNEEEEDEEMWKMCHARDMCKQPLAVMAFAEKTRVAFYSVYYNTKSDDMSLLCGPVADDIRVVVFAGGTEESRVEPIKEEEEKATEVVATTETKILYRVDVVILLRIVFYELLSDPDTKRKTRDPLGYYSRSWDAYGDKEA
ncbi:zinc knuckle CX2CX4HX4C containing protein [Tanacetum coccineum]